MLVKYYFRSLHTHKGWQLAMKFKSLIEANYMTNDVMRLNLPIQELHRTRRQAEDSLAVASMIGINKRYEQFEELY